MDHGYVHRVKDFQFIRGTFAALRRIAQSGFKCIIITDQSGIGRGYYKREDVERVHKHMLKEFSMRKIRIDGIYYCPHAPEDHCACRKPKTALVNKAQKEFRLNLQKSYCIGDKRRDIQMGKNAGCKTILVMTGHAGTDHGFSVQPDFVTKNLGSGAQLIEENER